VSLNYHTLSDFRVGHGELLDRLLTENVATLAACGLIDLGKLAQDGVRVHASAGATSYRRRPRLEEHLAQTRAVVEQLKREVDDDPAASNHRIRAARQRAPRTCRAGRCSAGQAARGRSAARAAAKDDRKQAEKQKEPRVSTTDPEVRILKMADGGFRPAWNGQVVSVAATPIVVGVTPCSDGSDRGLIRPNLDKLRKRFGRLPRRHLADGGFTAAADIEWAHGEGIEVYCPPTKSKHGGDACAESRRRFRACSTGEAG